MFLGTIVLLSTIGCQREKVVPDTKLSDSLQKQLDTLRIKTGIGPVHYTLQIVDGSTMSSSNGRTEGVQTTLDDVIVIISQNGRTRRDTIKVGGQIAYEGFDLGTVSVSLIKNGYTGTSFVAELTQTTVNTKDKYVYASTIVPMYNLSGTSLATVKGILAAELNITNATLERVPDRTVTASLNVSTVPKFTSKNAEILSRAYSGVTFSTRSNATGEFSFTNLPAGGEGSSLSYVIQAESFIFAQVTGVTSTQNTLYTVANQPVTVRALGIYTMSPLTYNGIAVP
ncbi:MAG: hypothetical protein EAZ55_00300 [Cytophagales bacterium]|nr:MAG: hypothetical protein EAZ55_00300 [Cytophagales bacterium]